MRILHHGLVLWPAAYKDVARCFVHQPAAPLERAIPDTTKCAVVLEAVQGQAFGVALRAILDRFCARRRCRSRGSGRRNGLSSRTKKL